jgi:hypothetical protein
MQIFDLCPPVAQAPASPLVAYAPALSAAAVALVGAITGYVAWRQWVTARTKLRLDLYDKRRPLYIACRDLIYSVYLPPGETAKASIWRTYYSARADAAFLCGPDVAAHMDKLTKSVSDHADETGGEAPASSKPFYDDQSDWQAAEAVKLEKAFAPYLHVERQSLAEWLRAAWNATERRGRP